MKKTALVAFAMLLTCGVFAQDSTKSSTATQHHTMVHKKTQHNNSTMPADSVNAGKITTNPNGKMGAKRKMPKNSTTPADSTK